jgi:hypothetical protein
MHDRRLQPMRPLRRWLLPLAAITMAAGLAGCVAYPAYPGYAYGYGPGYYQSAPVVVGGWGGWGWHHGWRDDGRRRW